MLAETVCKNAAAPVRMRSCLRRRHRRRRVGFTSPVSRTNEKPEAIASGFFGGALAIIFHLSIFAWSSAYVLFEGLRKILCILITAVLGDHVDLKIGLLK